MEETTLKITYEAPTAEILVIEPGSILAASTSDYRYGGMDE